MIKFMGVFLEFCGNMAADNRPNPLDSSASEDNSAAENSDDDDVRQEMIRVLSNE